MTPIDDPRPFSEVLRDWRKRHGLTAEAAAARIGATYATYRFWESGTRQCRDEAAYRSHLTMIDEGRA